MNWYKKTKYLCCSYLWESNIWKCRKKEKSKLNDKKTNRICFAQIFSFFFRKVVSGRDLYQYKPIGCILFRWVNSIHGNGNSMLTFTFLRLNHRCMRLQAKCSSSKNKNSHENEFSFPILSIYIFSVFSSFYSDGKNNSKKKENKHKLNNWHWTQAEYIKYGANLIFIGLSSGIQWNLQARPFVWHMIFLYDIYVYITGFLGHISIRRTSFGGPILVSNCHTTRKWL